MFTIYFQIPLYHRCILLLNIQLLKMNGTTTIRQILNVSKQYQQLEKIKDKLHGLYVLPREEDVFTWDGILFVSSGMWEEGIFKFTLKIPIE